MRPVNRLDGSTSYRVMDFKLSTTVIVDQAVIASTTGGDGGEIEDATTTSLADFVGSVLSASDRNPHGGGVGSLTYSTAVASGTPEGLVRVYINPDIVYEALMSGGATNNTALDTLTESAGDSNRVTVTHPAGPNNSMDDGTVWGLTGANAGQSRKITTYTADTSLVVTVPFVNTIAANDTFAVAPYLPLVTTTLQLSTTLDQADASIAVGTGGNARVVELVLNGTTDSFVRFIGRDMAFNELS